ncbi:sucrase ferredoxin [Streptomyces kunmingensis]|uniref:Sucrase ferredoxin n=1 Tax=Streptomyces kunmingensis TaxID=68225 RepID=A0ABU6CJZ9_9ACTN|nr:sucrase ferredoxin [Streptomyces kunmingensis]MEB3965013.1 sucrase ferredoxin [Streptomyces kunmingensis]
MTAAARFFCAEAAGARGDPLAGTAPYGSVWILVEYRGGWPPNGFDGLDLEPHIKGLVFGAAQAVRARVLLIRRHGRLMPDGPRRWAVLRHGVNGAYRQRWGTWDRAEDLLGIVDALGAPGEPGHPPVVLVCAHGLHDVCCAVRGRPVAQALSARWPQLVWECTHVGGDRFAANVVLLPDGVYYGRLTARSSVTTVEEHLADRMHADHLRGYTDLFPPQQAAVAAVLRRFGPAGRHAYAVESTTRDQDRWRIRLAARPPRTASFDIEVRSHRAPPYLLTCRGRSSSSAVVHEVTSLRAG